MRINDIHTSVMKHIENCDTESIVKIYNSIFNCSIEVEEEPLAEDPNQITFDFLEDASDV